jgi:hypothetical protein
MVAFDRANNDVADLYHDAPDAGLNLAGRHPVIHQQVTDISTASDRSPGAQRQGGRVAEMIVSGMRDKDEIRPFQFLMRHRRKRIAGQKRVDQNAVTRANDLKAGGAQEAEGCAHQRAHEVCTII